MSESALTIRAWNAPVIPSGDDASAVIAAAAARVTDLIESADYAELVILRDKWRLFLAAVARQRRKANGAAEAASRRIELAIGEAILCTNAPKELTSTEVSEFRMMARFRDVTEAVIADSTNDRPATRNAVIKAIRRFRLSTGDLAMTARDQQRATHELERRKANDLRAAKERDLERWGRERDARQLARMGTGKLPVVYQRIRQAQAELCASGLSGEAYDEAERSLINAEAAVVTMLREQRRVADGDKPPIQVPDILGRLVAS